MSAHLVRLRTDGYPEGWFGHEDARIYLDGARQLDVGARVVEVGSWLGRSLAVVLPTVIERGLALWSVDTWLGSPNDETSEAVAAGFDAYAAFKANMEHLGYWGAFTVIRDDQSSAANRFADGSLDLVFLDADHACESVAHDIRLWWPKLRKNGLLLGHDYGAQYPGVAKAVNAILGKPEAVCGTVWKTAKRC